MMQDTPIHQDESGAPRAQLGFGRSPNPDPVDAAIERHRAAREGLERATKGIDAAMTASKRAEADADAVFSAASDADGAAWADLIATRPADMPGAVRLLRYVSDLPATEILDDPQDLLRQLTAAVEAAEAGEERGEGAALAVEPDPALAVTAEYRVTWDALGAAIEAAGSRGVPDVPEAEAADSAAYARLRAVSPTTPAGFRALAETWAWRLQAERVTVDDGEPGSTASHAAASLIAGAGVCVPPAPCADLVDWHSPPPGFMASPAIEPFGFARIPEGIVLELNRLRGIALTDFERRTATRTTPEGEERLRRELRLDALEMAVRGDGGFAVGPGIALKAGAWDWQAEMARPPGFVPFPAHAPTMLLALDEAIRREAERFLALAEAEVERSRVAYLKGFEPHLWPRVERDLRREMRMDALALVAADLPEDDGAPDPVLAAIAASCRAEAEMAVFQDTARGDQPEAWTVREDELCKVQRDTRVAVWRTVPTTRAGRRALVDYARFQVGVHTGETGIIDNAKDLFEEILAPIAAAIAAERPEPALDTDATPAPGLLVNLILEGWAALAACDGSDTTAEEVAAYQRAADRRDELIDAAEALPASREAIAAKALALAWLEFVSESLPGQRREAHSFSGRIAWDIDQAVRRGVVPAGSYRMRPEHDLTVLSVTQLARLYEAMESVENILGSFENAPCSWDDKRTILTPNGRIINQEADRLQRLLVAIAKEIELRQPADDDERDERLRALARRAASLDGLTTDRALLTEALAACEG